ncbi:hypothetical protein TNCV_344111 [Trichonephila clavipes]|nr:hypothetical protein TNCV_344111 [Trichonephila clavipes]
MSDHQFENRLKIALKKYKANFVKFYVNGVSLALPPQCGGVRYATGYLIQIKCPKFDEMVLLWSPCQVIYSQFGLSIHQNDHQARRRFVEWAQNEIAVVPDFHKRILFRDEAHFWLNGYVNKQNCRIWSEKLMESLVRTSSKTMKATTLQSMVIGIEP